MNAMGKVEGLSLGAHLAAFDPAGQSADGRPVTVLQRSNVGQRVSDAHLAVTIDSSTSFVGLGHMAQVPRSYDLCRKAR